MKYSHLPVMCGECIRELCIKPEGIYVDATAGLGGHSFAIASCLTGGRLICIDKDEEAIAYCMERLRSWPVTFVHSDYRRIGQVIEELGVKSVDGILMDFGVSSLQLDKPQRGFSYKYDAPIDMRMNKKDCISAWDIVNKWPFDELKSILYRYGEERYSPVIARAIIDARPVNTTLQLAGIITRAMPAKGRREAQHPARRTFQAIRIAVNDELSAVEEGVTGGLSVLSEGGRMLCITFHSLEDRLVKKIFKQAQAVCTCPPDFPVCVCEGKKKFRTICRLTPSIQELEDNPRAASALLRVIEKC